ncbi:ribosomal protein S6 glutaminyl transferase [Lachnospiraceae bacterium KM106-2]|nr:ribosomal protein S6 glutaminyl transferase [Lachnospiraceae bacterium KM106-2]
MKAWLIYDTDGARKNAAYIKMHEEEGKKLGIEFIVLYTERITYGIKSGIWFLEYDGKTMERPDFVINRSINPLLSKQLEYMQYPLFNDAKTATICNDKARTYQYVASLSIPMVDTLFVNNRILRSTLENAEDKKVIKAVAGHGGSQVCLYDPSSMGEKEMEAILKIMNDSDVVVQPYVEGRKQDLRVYVIGDKIVGAVLRHAKSGFKSNYSLGGEVSSYQLSEQEVAVVDKICNAFQFGLVGIDFLIGSNGELIFNEIEDVVGARMLYATSDINLVREYLQFIIRTANL